MQAAKRSRENKRTMELEIRNRANQLEEQNALLTKELFVIKRQYGLPLDRSILSAEEQAQCIQVLASRDQPRRPSEVVCSACACVQVCVCERESAKEGENG